MSLLDFVQRSSSFYASNLFCFAKQSFFCKKKRTKLHKQMKNTYTYCLALVKIDGYLYLCIRNLILSTNNLYLYGFWRVSMRLKFIDRFFRPMVADRHLPFAFGRPAALYELNAFKNPKLGYHIVDESSCCRKAQSGKWQCCFEVSKALRRSRFLVQI